jgi:hypothetical protein
MLWAAWLTPRVARADDKHACAEAFSQAQKLRDAHSFTAARDQLQTCSRDVCPRLMVEKCREWLSAVREQLASVVLIAKDAAGGTRPNVRVFMDGAVVADSLDGRSIDVDPGRHTFVFVAADGTRVEETATIHEGQKAQPVTATFAARPAPPAAPTAEATSTPPTGTHATVAPTADSGAKSGGGMRTVGLVVAGVGAAALVTGAIFGALTISAHGSYEQSCGASIGAPAGFCNADGVSGRNDAATKGTIATVAFVAGGVAVAAGATLFVLAPGGRASASQVGVGLGPASVSLRGSF